VASSVGGLARKGSLELRPVNRQCRGYPRVERGLMLPAVELVQGSRARGRSPPSALEASAPPARRLIVHEEGHGIVKVLAAPRPPPPPSACAARRLLGSAVLSVAVHVAIYIEAVRTIPPRRGFAPRVQRPPLPPRYPKSSGLPREQHPPALPQTTVRGDKLLGRLIGAMTESVSRSGKFVVG